MFLRSARVTPKLRSAHLVALATLTIAAGCGSDSSSGGDSHDPRDAPFGPVGREARPLYRLARPDGTSVERQSTTVGTQDVGGVTVDHVLLEDVNGVEPVVELWGTQDPEGGAIFAGASTDEGSVMLDTPLVIDADQPVGSELPVAGTVLVSVAEDYEIGGITLPISEGPASIDGSYTLTDVDAGIETPMGTVWGCRRYEGTTTVGANSTGIPEGTVLDGSLYWHERYGVVAAEVPLLGISLEMLGVDDRVELGGGYRTISKTGIVDAQHPWFRLSSYDFSDANDADKETHSKMLLELRWVDDGKAKSEDEPGYPSVSIEFGTLFGYFPHTMVRSDYSVFYPEENGEGYVYWVGFVDEAAKNETLNGISYRVEVNADTNITQPIRATARIVYKTVDASD